MLLLLLLQALLPQKLLGQAGLLLLLLAPTTGISHAYCLLLLALASSLHRGSRHRPMPASAGCSCAYIRRQEARRRRHVAALDSAVFVLQPARHPHTPRAGLWV